MVNDFGQNCTTVNANVSVDFSYFLKFEPKCYHSSTFRYFYMSDDTASRDSCE